MEQNRRIATTDVTVISMLVKNATTKSRAIVKIVHANVNHPNPRPTIDALTAYTAVLSDATTRAIVLIFVPKFITHYLLLI
jgi:hypothetical protein